MFTENWSLLIFYSFRMYNIWELYKAV
jgi:hypothetical protein